MNHPALRTVPTAPAAAPEMSAILALQKAKPRTFYAFDIADILGLPAPQVVHIRVATKKEQSQAVAEAHAFAAKMAGKDLPAAASDDDILADAKAACLLALVVREASDDPNKAYPVWPTGEVAMESITPDRIAAILNLVIEARMRDAPWPKGDTSDETMEALIAYCAAAAGTGQPEQHLAGCTREFLLSALVVASVKLYAERAAAAERLRRPETETPEEPAAEASP